MSEEEIFHDALLRRDSEERAAFLDRACGADAALRASVEALLRANEGATEFFRQPADYDGQQSTVQHAIAESAGALIGPYKLLEQIGEGGFGVVFMAEQAQPIRRKVALKILKPGMDTRQVVTRFEAERQALAIMDHPNIAKVYDGGATPSGRPYFVMELVRGVAITEFCDQNQLTPRQRLELFVSVCRAVQHAHQKGIIHRDLKPSNVLVTLHNTAPVVKVIDFGVAKALGQELTEKTLFTGFAQMIGTPVYMSPEQAGASSLDIDTRSDIYSLGVLLYELLTGSTPFKKDRFKRAAYEEIRRIIREEDPPRPSTRLSESRDTLPSISALRRTEPGRLAKLMRGELDWIVMKCLEKDRKRRYETANGLAMELQRYLADEPVRACPPSTFYRLRKFARRHRVGLATLACVLLASIAGAGVASWHAVRASRAERTALEERDEKEEARAAEFQQRKLAEQRHKEAASHLYVARLAAMNEAADSGNFTRLRRLLKESTPEKGEPDYRGWEWRLLKDQSLRNHTELVGSEPYTGFAAWSQASGQIAAATHSGAIDILDSHGNVVRTLQPRGGEIRWLRWSPDGERLASVADGKLSLWDASGKLLHALPAELRSSAAMAWSPDGKRVALAGADGHAHLWDAVQGTKLRTLNTNVKGDYVTDLAWHPDGERLASGNRGGRTNVWNTNTGDLLFTRTQEGAPIYAVGWDPTGTKLASGGSPSICIWDEHGNRLAVFCQHAGTVQELSWSPDGKHLLSGADDRTVHVWDVTNRRRVALVACDERIRSLGWRADGKQLLIGLVNPNIPAWSDSEAASVSGVFLVGGFESSDRAHVVMDSGARFAKWSPNGKWIAAADITGAVQIVAASDGRRLHQLRSETRLSRWAFVSWDRNSRRVAVATRGSGTVWNAETGERLAVLASQYPEADLVQAWSPDGRWIALCLAKGSMELWDTASWKRMKTFPVGGEGVEIVWSPDSRLVAIGCSHSTSENVYVYEMHEGRLLYRTRTPHAVGSLVFSPCGAWLIAASNVDLVFFRARTGERIRIGRGGHGIINCVRWSPDGRRLAAGCRDGCVRIWDAATATELFVLHCGLPINTVGWSPDSSGLACTDVAGRLRIWSVTLPADFNPAPLAFQRRPRLDAPTR